MGFVRDFKSDITRRHDANLRGTKRLLDHCAHYGVQKVVVFSSGTVYGALHDNPFYMDEDRALEASRAYPEIRDLVEVDALATTFLWRYPHISTCVLRPVNVLGHYVRSMISEYLRLDRQPTVLGFDPLMQFIHEQDVVEAIASRSSTGSRACSTSSAPARCRSTPRSAKPEAARSRCRSSCSAR
jgi:UDP-glucose 4-epimerase